MKGKKGFIGDIPVMLFVLVILAMCSLFAIILADAFNDSVQGNTAIPSSVRSAANTYNSRLPLSLDGLFLVAYAILVILMLISAYQIGSNPGFFVIVFIVFLVVMLLAFYTEQYYAEVVENATLGSATTLTPGMSWVFDHLGMNILGVGILLIVVLFAKPRGADGA